jgi:hypothetical protein
MKKSILQLSVAIALATTAFAANAASYNLVDENYTLVTEMVSGLLDFDVVPAKKTNLDPGGYTNELTLTKSNSLPTADGSSETPGTDVWNVWSSSNPSNNIYNFTMTTTTGDQLSGTFKVAPILTSKVTESFTKYYMASSVFTGGTGLFAGATGSGSFQIITTELVSPASLATEISNFSAAFSTPTAPIPEADTSTMLLMGAGIMGFIARRRKNIQT